MKNKRSRIAYKQKEHYLVEFLQHCKSNPKVINEINIDEINYRYSRIINFLSRHRRRGLDMTMKHVFGNLTLKGKDDHEENNNETR